MDEQGNFRVRWLPARIVKGVPYDTPLLAEPSRAGRLLRAGCNTASLGRFSSDRAIREYAERIWHVKPVAIAESAAVTVA